jgi:DNA primase
VQSYQKQRRGKSEPLQQQFDRSFIEHIKQIADPELVASSLGIMFQGPRGRYLRAQCPIHGGKNKTSFSLDTDTGSWSCFSSGCHHGYSDLIGLVELVRRYNFMEAIKYIATLMGIDISKQHSEEVTGALYRKDVSDYIRRTQRNNVEMNLRTISNIEESVYGWMLQRSEYFVRKGYTPNILDYFEVGSSFDRKGIPRDVFPIRDSVGRIVAVDGRRTDSDENPRYFAEPPGFPKGKVLYHYDRARNYIKLFKGHVFVVEGYKACWSMVQAGYLNTVACMGAGFQGEQAGILLKDLSLRKIIMVLDSDAAGKNGSQRAKSQLSYLCPVEIIDMPVTQDPITLEPIYHDPSTLPVNVLHSIIIPHTQGE